MGINKQTVLVNGMGNIGTTIANLLVQYKTELDINQIYVCKRSIYEWNKVERTKLEEQGVIICSTDKHDGMLSLADVLSEVHYIFEATSNGVGLLNINQYKTLPNLIGSCAQGSEKGYGIPFMSGINDEIVKNEKFVNIVSCNTHGTASLLKTFCGDRLQNLAKADVVVVRRSEDIGNHERLVTANVVARHLDESIGTHHAIDVVDMFKTIEVGCQLTSSDITTPSQLMHSVRFNIQLKEPLGVEYNKLIDENFFLSTTTKFDSNVVFELGRRYGFNGRLFSHAIVLDGNMLITDDGVKGWAFVPQEGNSILSTIHAYLLQMFGDDKKDVFVKICNDLLQKEW